MLMKFIKLALKVMGLYLYVCDLSIKTKYYSFVKQTQTIDGP